MKKTSTSTSYTFPLYIYDIHESAYLQFKGLSPELKKEGTRVVFCFPNTPETQSLIDDYYTNPTVRLVDYISHLRRLRAQMLSMRG
jgi:hypothetical protein